MTNTAQEAVEFERQRATSGVQLPAGDCLGSCRDAYFGVGAHAYGGTAAEAWAATKIRHGIYETPRLGALVFFTGGSTGAGHIGISNGEGYFWNTDFGPNGYIGDGRIRLIPIAAVNQHDPALKYVGWSEDLDGTEVLDMTDADKAFFNDLGTKIVEAVVLALSEGANQAGGLLPDTGYEAALKRNIGAVLNAVASAPTGTASGSIDYAALAKAVNDDAAKRLQA